MTGKINPLPNMKWSTAAALASANERVPNDAQSLVCIWVDKSNTIHWSISSSKANGVYMLEVLKLKLMTE